MSLLRGSPVLDGIADVIWDACQHLSEELREAAEAKKQEAEDAQMLTADELHARMVDDGAMVLAFGGTPMFYAGIDSMVGMPAIDLPEGMRREHCAEVDSDWVRAPRPDHRHVSQPRTGRPDSHRPYSHQPLAFCAPYPPSRRCLAAFCACVCWAAQPG
eukprot:1546688-Prymnesium_polylepis.1